MYLCILIGYKVISMTNLVIFFRVTGLEGLSACVGKD